MDFRQNNRIFINKKLVHLKTIIFQGQLMMNFADFQRNNGVCIEKKNLKFI